MLSGIRVTSRHGEKMSESNDRPAGLKLTSCQRSLNCAIGSIEGATDRGGFFFAQLISRAHSADNGIIDSRSNLLTARSSCQMRNGVYKKKRTNLR